MPIYEYKCSECGNVYEKRQKFSDPVDTVCNCEKQAPVTRITSAPALVFKGSGWYINDYARAGNGAKNGKSDGEKADSGSKDTPAKSDNATKASDSTSSTSSAGSSTTTTPTKA